MKQLLTFASASEATNLKQRLGDAGIPFFEMSDLKVDANQEVEKAPGVKIMINDSDYQKALILANIH